MCPRAVAPNACPERGRRNAHHLAALDLEGNVLESPNSVVGIPISDLRIPIPSYQIRNLQSAIRNCVAQRVVAFLRFADVVEFGKILDADGGVRHNASSRRLPFFTRDTGLTQQSN
jgi:hypothetical protein